MLIKWGPRQRLQDPKALDKDACSCLASDGCQSRARASMDRRSTNQLLRK